MQTLITHQRSWWCSSAGFILQFHMLLWFCSVLTSSEIHSTAWAAYVVHDVRSLWAQHLAPGTARLTSACSWTRCIKMLIQPLANYLADYWIMSGGVLIGTSLTIRANAGVFQSIDVDVLLCAVRWCQSGAQDPLGIPPLGQRHWVTAETCL